MSFSDSGLACHQTASFAIRAFACALEAEARDGVVPVAVIQRLRDALAVAPGPLSGAYVAAHSSCASAFAHEQVLQQRKNPLGRLLVKPFAPLFDNPKTGVERTHLEQFFEAVRIILGAEKHERLSQRCHEVFDDLAARTSQPWEAFYVDGRSVEMFELVLIDMVRAFQRFDIRREWFLTVMNHHSAYQSTGSRSFVRRDREENPASYFGPRQLDLVLGAMFATLRDASPDRRHQFRQRHGIDSGALFSPMMLHLTRARAWPG